MEDSAYCRICRVHAFAELSNLAGCYNNIQISNVFSLLTGVRSFSHVIFLRNSSFFEFRIVFLEMQRVNNGLRWPEWKMAVGGITPRKARIARRLHSILEESFLI